MEEAAGARFWCHMCSQTVNPVREAELKCPFCLSGFVEEMDSTSRGPDPDESELATDRALALWAPILLGMMSNQRNRPRMRPHFLGEHNTDDENENEERPREGETELDREVNSIIRRRRSDAAVLRLLQGITSGISAGAENSENSREREREGIILINPFDQTLIVQGGSEDSSNNHGLNQLGSLGDYFVGPGLDLLLQHIAENDPNRYGTPPAQKEAVESLSTVKIGDNSQCPVCLDDFEPDAEAKEMPCKHKFHSGCLLPWLELHSSCPVCRFQLPADESKHDAEVSRGVSSNGSQDENQVGSESSFTLPWPLNAFSSFSRSRGNSSVSPSASSSGGGRGDSTSQAEGN